MHPGPDITGPAAASLTAVTAGQARRALAKLARAHLTAEHAPGRLSPASEDVRLKVGSRH